jgi:uncharacterized protein
MTLAFLALLTFLGFAGAVIAGLLGVGGAIIMIPLLLYVPPWSGFSALPVNEVAAISMVQVFFAALSGAIAHGRRGAVHRTLALTVGASAALGAFVGGVTSRWFSPLALLTVFGMMASLGAVLMSFAPREVEVTSAAAPEVSYRRPRAILIGLGVGTMAGLVGAGGAFLIVPLLITVVGVPTRITIGSSLAITLWTGAAGLVGKLASGQVPLAASSALVLGAIPGAQVGEWVGRHLGVRSLKGALAVLTALVALRIWIDVLSRL